MELPRFIVKHPSANRVGIHRSDRTREGNVRATGYTPHIDDIPRYTLGLRDRVGIDENTGSLTVQKAMYLIVEHLV